jgi:hypothetical protein
MAQFNYLRKSFLGGQVSDEAAGRLDLPQVQEGAKELTNFLPNYYGALRRRPGTEYVTSAASDGSASRLIPFEASDDESYLLEFAPDGDIIIYNDDSAVVWSAKTSNLAPNGHFTGSNAGWTSVLSGRNSPLVYNNANVMTPTALTTQPDLLNSAFTSDVSYWNASVGCTWSAGTIVLSSVTEPAGPHIHQTVPILVAGSYVITTDITNVGAGSEVYISVGTAGYRSSNLFVETLYNTTGAKTHAFTVPSGVTGITYTCIGGDANSVTLTSVSMTTKPTPGIGSYAYTVLPPLIAGTYNVTAGGNVYIGTTVGGTDLGLIVTSGSFTVSAADEGPIFVKTSGNLSSLSITRAAGETSLRHPYSGTQLDNVKYAQDKNTVHLVHPELKPRRLVRYSNTEWSMATIDSSYTLEVGDPTALVSGGPYLKINTTDIEIGLSATSGSSVTAVSSGPVFNTGDVGRYLRWKSAVPTDAQSVEYVANGTQTAFVYDVQLPRGHLDLTVILVDGGYKVLTANTDYYLSASTGTEPSTVTLATAPPAGAIVTIQRSEISTGSYGYGKITAVTSGTKATIKVYSPFDGISIPSKDWMIGGFSDSLGYPAAVAIHEQRAWYGGVPGLPGLVFSSTTGSTGDFRPDNGQGTVLPTSAITIEAASKKLSKIEWIVPRNNLVIGTSSSLYELVPTDIGLSATDLPSVKHRSESGVRNVDALPVQDFIIYSSRVGSHLMAARFEDGRQALESPILSINCPELFNSPIKRLAHQDAPDSIIWVLKEDGTLVSCTFRPDAGVVAFAGHDVGGIVDDICTVRKGDSDTLYLSVYREVNGVGRRYIEKMRPSLQPADRNEAWHLDSAKVVDGTVDTAMSLSARSGSVTVDVIASTFTAADVGKLIKIKAEDVVIKITGFTSPTSVTGTLMQTCSTTTYAGGEWALSFTEAAGFDHLNGMSVSVWADGGPHQEVSVSSGRISLTRPCFYIAAGLPFTSTVVTTDLSIESPNMGNMQGNIRRVRSASIQLKDSGTCLISSEAGSTTERLKRYDVSPSYNNSQELLTGRFDVQVSSDYDYDCRVRIESETAAPLNIQNIILKVDIGGSK